ncbi:MAG: hypothetical protein ABI596_17960 [Pyrinomonadaceae bacterium]
MRKTIQSDHAQRRTSSQVSFCLVLFLLSLQPVGGNLTDHGIARSRAEQSIGCRDSLFSGWASISSPLAIA